MLSTQEHICNLLAKLPLTSDQQQDNLQAPPSPCLKKKDNASVQLFKANSIQILHVFDIYSSSD